MGSRVVIDRWCDNHDGSEDFPAEERMYLDADGKPRLADTCDDCDANMTNSQVRQYVAKFGRPLPVEAKGKSAGRVKPNSAQHNAMQVAATGVRKGRKPAEGHARLHHCLWCVLDYAAPSGLSKHLADLHGFPTAQDAYGRVCPICAQGGIDVMGGHVVRTHADIASNVSEAFIWARDNGDPHGIYAERLKAGKNVQLVAA